MDIEKAIEFILNSQANAVGRLDKVEAVLDRMAERQDKTEVLLRRAIRLAVREARNQRRRNRLLDEKITQLAAAQLVTEEKLQGLIESLRLRNNGQR